MKSNLRVRVVEALLALSAFGCGEPVSETLLEQQPASQASGDLRSVSFGPDGEPVDASFVDSFEAEPATRAPQTLSVAVSADQKIGAELRARLAESIAAAAGTAATTGSGTASRTASSSARSRAEFIDVTFVLRDPVDEPQLPSLNPLLPRDAPENAKRLATRLDAFEKLKAHRSAVQAPVIRAIEAAGGLVGEQFVSCNCFVAKTPPDPLKTLIQNQDILHVELSESPTPPPVDTNTANDIADAKLRFNHSVLSPYRATAGQSIALLDTGVRWTHTSLASGVSWQARLDCVFGGTGCATSSNAGFNPDDNDWNHGTSTASILVGNTNLGSDHGGLLGSAIGSFKVYTASGLNRAATLRAFDAARAGGYDVIVAEMQDSDPSLSSALATAAASAFDSGIAVIAANGNAGQRCQTDANGQTIAGQVGGPAHAKKVIGIGTYDINSSTDTPLNHCVGPTADGRVKPDILMPTRTEAASTTSSTATRSFSGTSGATPYGGAAAMLIRNFYFANGWDASPGNVYAGLIANGSGSMLGPVSSRAGAGAVKLRPRSCSRWYNGWRTVSNGQVIDIPFDVGAGAQDISMAIWWPEGNDYHNNVDLTISNPAGTTRWHSSNVGNVWERINLKGVTGAGSWTATIKGTSVPRGPQKVWLLLHTKLPGC
jgi:hypothetical protein